MSKNNELVRDLLRQRDIESLKKLYESAAITRRAFVSRLAALGVGAGIAGIIVAGSRVAVAATPKRGGRIRAAAGAHGPDDTLDPARFNSVINYGRGEQFYNGLTRIDEFLVAQPDLAVSWEPNADGTEWVFKLRKGVEFHSGKSLDAEDALYSIQRHLDKDVGSGARAFVENVAEGVVEDKHTVRFKLKGPDADFPVILGTYQMKIVPAGTTDFSSAPGTGPFKLEEFKPGVRSVAYRNPNYWEEGRPYLDEIEWFGITDHNARMNALLAGDVSMMSGLDPRAIRRIEATRGVRVVNTKAGQYTNLAMMTDRAPTDSNELRLAIKYLQNRERILKLIYKGNGMLGNDQPISPVDPMYCDEIPIRPFDSDKARHHLKKAGMDGGSIRVHTAEAAGTGAVEQVLMLQREADGIGLKVHVQRDPGDGYWSATWGKRPFFMSGWNMRPTANIMLTLAFNSDAAWNEARWKNARFDELLNLGRATLDPVERKRIYCEAQTLIHETGGVAIPCFIDYLDAMSDKVKGFIPLPLGPLGASQWPRSIWLES
jgi:peptide/nickel transport system substrate-binding protein